MKYLIELEQLKSAAKVQLTRLLLVKNLCTTSIQLGNHFHQCIIFALGILLPVNTYVYYIGINK